MNGAVVNTYKDRPFKRKLLSYLRGEEKLYKAFWVVWLFAGYSLKLIIFSISYIIELETADNNLVKIWNISCAVIILFPYVIFSVISVWRCAFNTSHKVFGYMARTFIVLYYIYTSLNFLAVFFGIK